MDKLTELKEIKAKLEQSEKEFKQIRADICCVTENKDQEVYYKCLDACYLMVSNLREYVYRIEGDFYRTMEEHRNGHLPKIQGAEKMENALEILGLNQDYEVMKPTIYVRASRNGNKNFDIELNIPKKIQ